MRIRLLPFVLAFVLSSELLTALDYEGTDFCFSFPTNIEDTASSGIRYVRLFIGSRHVTQVDIYAAGIWKGSLTTRPEELVSFDLAPEEAQAVVLHDSKHPVPEDQVYFGKAIRITAQDPIYIYGLNRKQSSTDGFLLLPVTALDTGYVVASYESTLPDPRSHRASQFMVVAPFDSTTITVTFPMTTPNHAAGDTATYLLNRDDVFSAMSVGHMGDLTGAVIRSDRPIAVMAGHDGTYIPNPSIEAADHISEMMTPTSSWGTVYHAMPYHNRRKGDTYRIIASQPETEVFINGESYAMIPEVGGDSGTGWVEFRETPRRALVFTSDKPILVAHYNHGGTYDNPHGGSDPFYILLLRSDSLGRASTIISPGRDFDNNFLTVIADSAGMATAEIDTTDIPFPQWTRVTKMKNVMIDTMPDVGRGMYIGATFPIGDDRHYNLRCASGSMGVYSYGGESYDSYGYAGAPLLELPSAIDTVPPSVTFFLGCDGSITGVARDLSVNRSLVSGLSLFRLDSLGSSNVRLIIDSTGRNLVRFRLLSTDPELPPFAIVIAEDSAGNRVMDTVDFSPVTFSYATSPFDFGMRGVGSVTARFITLINSGTRGTILVSAEFSDGTIGFRLQQPWTSIPFEEGRHLTLPIEFAGTQLGVYRDTLVITDSCGSEWRLPLIAEVSEGIGDVEAREGLSEEMWMQIVPNALGTGMITITWASPKDADASLRIIDATGKTVHAWEAVETDGEERSLAVDIGQLPNGIYWCVLSAGQGDVIRQFRVF